MHAQPRRECRRHGPRDMRVLAPHADAVRANKHVCMLRWLVQLVTSPQELPVGYYDYFTSTTAAYSCSICCPPVPVPVLAPQASTPSACVRVCVRQGRAHRLRARDRAVPSERDGAIAHGDCASVPLHTAPVRRRPAARTQPRARPARAAEGRRTVALVSEIATPSNTSSPLNMKTAPPFTCTRADAEALGRAM